MGTQITPDQLALYATSMVTQEELGQILGVTQQAVSKMLTKPAMREAWDRGRASTKQALRRAQIEFALKGDRTMLVWAGKQYLDQRDSPKEIDIKSDVQVRYIAEWAGAAPEELPAPAGDLELIEGEAEEEE